MSFVEWLNGKINHNFQTIAYTAYAYFGLMAFYNLSFKAYKLALYGVVLSVFYYLVAFNYESINTWVSRKLGD